MDFENVITDEENASDEDEVLSVAQNAFGIKYLYPWQRLVIANILDASGYDSSVVDEDGAERGKQIVLLPTGAGKSLCFLIPALLLHGPTLILYPLLALMSDQERRMIEGKMEPVTFRGNQTAKEREENFEKIKNGAKVILANPEVLQNDELLEQLCKCGISHIAIDEAHCVSEWGDSFRPAYLTLGTIIKKLNVPLVTAFTATASEDVLQRISEILFDGKAHLVRGESDRANIKYKVVKAYAKDKAVLDAAVSSQKPLIVFCSSRKNAENTSRMLKEYFALTKPDEDIVRFYHAGLEKSEKTEIEKWFHPHPQGILVATCAYGMGVDKKNIRTVIHRDAPTTAEAYVQEAGRGGRDGEDAQAILIWSSADKLRNAEHKIGSRQRVLFDFAEATICRREILLNALGGEETVCSGCDICDGTTISEAQDAKFVYDFIKKNPARYSQDEAVNLLKNKLNEKSLEKHGFNIWETNDISEIIEQLLTEGKLTKRQFPWKEELVAK